MDSTVKRSSSSPNHALDTKALKLDVLVENAINGSFEAFDKIMVHYRERMYGVI